MWLAVVAGDTAADEVVAVVMDAAAVAVVVVVGIAAAIVVRARRGIDNSYQECRSLETPHLNFCFGTKLHRMKRLRHGHHPMY